MKLLKQCLIAWLIAWYPLAIAAFNFAHPSIDYYPSRYTIKKQEKGTSEQYKPEKTYAVFVSGFPRMTVGPIFDEKRIRELVKELNNKTNTEATFISYKDYQSGEDYQIGGNIQSALENKIIELSKKITKKDSFIFVYSGHGSKGADKGAIELGPRGYIWGGCGNDGCKDCEDGSFGGTLQGYLDKINSKHQILIFDSCYSGNLAETLKRTNRITISVGAKGYAIGAILGGFIPDIFTNNEKADTNKNGKVSLEESFIYASKNQWFTNYTNVFLQLPRKRPHLFSEGIDPNTIYLLDGGKE